MPEGRHSSPSHWRYWLSKYDLYRAQTGRELQVIRRQRHGHSITRQFASWHSYEDVQRMAVTFTTSPPGTTPAATFDICPIILIYMCVHAYFMVTQWFLLTNICSYCIVTLVHHSNFNTILVYWAFWFEQLTGRREQIWSIVFVRCSWYLFPTQKWMHMNSGQPPQPPHTAMGKFCRAFQAFLARTRVWMAS